MEPAVLAAGLAKAAAPSAIALLRRVGKERYDRFIATYTNVFNDHIRATTDRCAKIKTILHRDEPVPLESQYVPLVFLHNEDPWEDGRAVNYVRDLGKALLVSGLAGSGKSMFMKWAALRLIEGIPETQRIPLFVEIREVANDQLELPLDQIIFRMSSSEVSTATFDQFRIGLMEGQFIIMIDGLDEVPVKHRDAILREIADFRRRFPNASLICSSRPDHQLESSNSLLVLHVRDMTVEQIEAVIGNAKFDAAKKSAFISALKDGLYDQHKSFLSNPLLATIMLITYDVGTGVPNKLSLFYSQVYESLFYKHDSSKGVYVREHYTGLDIDEFEEVFRTFCFQSYAMSRVTFTSSAITDLVRTSLAQTRIKARPSDFIKDCKKSLSLLQEDGIFTSFVHRSFQEYFAAKYLSTYGGEQYYPIVDEIITKGFSDNTFTMLCQISSDDVLRRWSLPKISELISKLHDATANVMSMRDFLTGFAASVYFYRDTGEGISFSWAYKNEIRFIHAIDEVLAACGIEERVRVHDSNIYKDADRTSAPKELFRLMELEDEYDDDEEEPYRHQIQLSEIPPDLLFATGLPQYLDGLRQSLELARMAVEQRITATDDFAKRVNELFGSSRH